MAESRDTQAQRERRFVTLLDEKMDYIRVHLCDKLHYFDNKPKSGGLKFADMAWRLGAYEFLFRYDECPDELGSAVFRIRWQPYTPGETQDNWEDIRTLGQLDDRLRQARKSKALTANDRKAIELADKHEGPEPENLILVGLTGSRAYGLAHDGYTDPVLGDWVPPSDTDTRGVFVVPTKQVISLPSWKAQNGVKELVEQKKTDTKYDELERFLELCLQCNPERLEMLASAKTLETDEGKLLVENQKMFLSRRAIKTYGGYAQQQLYRVEKKEERFTKPAMHLIRLMITGIRILQDGAVNPDMSEYRDQLLAIRTGEMPLEEVFLWHHNLNVEFAKWADETKLPEQPDFEKANRIFLEIRKSRLEW